MNTESKQVQVYNQIKEDILNGEYPPGAPMVERKLCDIYHVSRSPIRNALQMLLRDGLVSYVPGKGMTIPEITIEDIFEIYDLVELFQRYAIRRFLPKVNEISLNALENVLQHSRKALDDNDLREAIYWDMKFHELLAEFSASERLKTFYDQVSGQVGRFLSVTLDDTSLAERSYTEHRSIYESLSRHDGEGAERAVSEHYKHTKQYYIERLLENKL